MSLVPMASIGGMLSVPTPAIDLVIDLAQMVSEQDYRSSGRTVRSLGIEGMSVEQIHKLVTDGFVLEGR